MDLPSGSPWICRGVERIKTPKVFVTDSGLLCHLNGAGAERGVVLYTGEQPLPFGDRLAAVPISGLWTRTP